LLLDTMLFDISGENYPSLARIFLKQTALK